MRPSVTDTSPTLLLHPGGRTQVEYDRESGNATRGTTCNDGQPYEVHGDTASGGAYWTETTLVNSKPAVVGSGHYVDELKKVNGKWKFTKRTVIRDVPAMTAEEMAHAPEIKP
jgi:SnoaL-like domain